jgi:hypothetical protein
MQASDEERDVAFSVDWHPDFDDVLLMTFIGNPTMGEALDATERESELIEASPHTVHTIIDLRQQYGIPRNFIGNMPRIASTPAASHPNAGLKVVVGASGPAAAVLGIFSRLYNQLHMVSSMEEAREIIAQQRA